VVCKENFRARLQEFTSTGSVSDSRCLIELAATACFTSCAIISTPDGDNSGNIGKEMNFRAHRSAIGKAPGRYPILR
jgi:hypothetical protein